MTEQHAQSPQTQSDRPAEPPGTPVFVDVFARTLPDGSVDFTHEWRWKENGPIEGSGTIKIPSRKPKEPGTPMHFHLRDETEPKRGLSFVENRGAAMWVLRNGCPPEADRCNDPEIPADRMSVTPAVLTAFDENNEECTLHYRLWFKDKDGNLETYDPDITNGGKTMF